MHVSPPIVTAEDARRCALELGYRPFVLRPVAWLVSIIDGDPERAGIGAVRPRTRLRLDGVPVDFERRADGWLTASLPADRRPHARLNDGPLPAPTLVLRGWDVLRIGQDSVVVCAYLLRATTPIEGYEPDAIRRIVSCAAAGLPATFERSDSSLILLPPEGTPPEAAGTDRARLHEGRADAAPTSGVGFVAFERDRRARYRIVSPPGAFAPAGLERVVDARDDARRQETDLERRCAMLDARREQLEHDRRALKKARAELASDTLALHRQQGEVEARGRKVEAARRTLEARRREWLQPLPMGARRVLVLVDPALPWQPSMSHEGQNLDLRLPCFAFGDGRSTVRYLSHRPAESLPWRLVRAAGRATELILRAKPDLVISLGPAAAVGPATFDVAIPRAVYEYPAPGESMQPRQLEGMDATLIDRVHRHLNNRARAIALGCADTVVPETPQHTDLPPDEPPVEAFDCTAAGIIEATRELDVPYALLIRFIDELDGNGGPEICAAVFEAVLDAVAVHFNQSGG